MKFSLLSVFASVLATQVAGAALEECKPTSHPAFFNCGNDSDSVYVSGININPAKPSKGDKAILTISGYLSSPLTTEARVKYVATSNGQVVKEVEAELCAFLSQHNVGINCPVAPKAIQFGIELNFPAELPNGPYVVHATAVQGSQQVFNFKVMTVL